MNYSFRKRIVCILILAFVLTTTTLYILHNQTKDNIVEEVERQRDELADAVSIAQQAISSTKWLREFLEGEKQKKNCSQCEYDSHVKHIFVVNDDGKVEDSSNGEDINKNFSELGFGNFSQIVEEGKKINDLESTEKYRIYTFPLQVDSKNNLYTFSKVYLIVVFRDNIIDELREWSDNQLFGTIGVLLLILLVSIWLILKFTYPIDELVEAVRQVGLGNLRVQLPVKQRDEVGNLIAVFNDMVGRLNEQQALVSRLHQAEQTAMVGRLATGIAHEIKNPLNYISLTIDYIRKKYKPSDETVKNQFFDKVDGIKDEVKRLDRLVRNFLSYGRPHHLNIKLVSVRELIKGILKVSEEQSKQQSIDIEFDEETNIPLIGADGEWLRSCFSNLLLNAQQAMPNGGKLSISFGLQREGVEVMITDTGEGIAQSNMDKIFEPYFSTKETGTGIGLALVRKIVEDHKGSIKVESKPQQGTTVYVWLPGEAYKPSGQKINDLDKCKLEEMKIYL